MTHDPLAAANPRHSAWVSANAGAGKTYTLAARVSRLLLDGAKPERILCLTYTKAAAAEMADRLFKQLGKWSMLDDNALSKEIASIGATAHDAKALNDARKLFAMALETPGGLKIQTIHAFCQHLLARFPLEAGIPPSFDVLDDQTARELIAAARQRILERAGSGDPTLAAATTHLITQTSEARFRDILDAALGSDRRKLEGFLESTPAASDGFFQAVRAAHGAGMHDTEESIAADFRAALKGEVAKLRSAAEALSKGGKTDAARADAILGALAADKAIDFFIRLREALLTKAGEPLKTLATKAVQNADAGLEPFLRSIESHLLAAEERRRAAHAASLAEAALTLCDAVHREYAHEKRLRGVLDYDDLIARALTLLEKKDAATWVLYKLDGGLDHILIDEAQDTSPAQWRIVQKLTEEFFADKGNDRRRRTVFAVGDEKQSIFSFQGADPKEFTRNRHYFASRAGKEEFGFANVQLATSRRSVPEVLSFVDQVFADPAAREGLTSDGANVVHSAYRATHRGHVAFWPSLKPDEGPEPDALHPVDVQSKASPVARLAEQIAQQIKSWTDGRTRLPGHEKAIQPADIMILLPRREPFASEIIRKLKDLNVPVAGADRLKIGNQIAVMDMMALGRFVLLPDDDLNLAALLRSPLVDISEEDLMALCANREGSLWRALSMRRTEFSGAHAFLSAMRSRADFAPPYEFFAHVLGVLGMRRRFLARLGGEAKDALDEFLSLALSYEAANPPSLQGFLHWIERGDAEIKRDMEHGRNEVRVMTVHGAKGLEADIVILPDTTSLPEDPGKHGDLLYTDGVPVYPVSNTSAPVKVRAAKDAAKEERLREHRRLLYVALTRARDVLQICGFESKRGVRPGSWYELAERAAKTLGRELVQGGETLRVLGDAQFETIAATEPQATGGADIPAWATTPAPKERERPLLIRPSQAAGEDEPPVKTPGTDKSAFQRGTLVHALLARLPDIAASAQRDTAIAFLQARGMTESDAAILTEQTLAVMTDPRFADVFAADARAEVAIVAELPEIAEDARVNGRIDRLAVNESRVLAVDFKTGTPKETAPLLYRTQMALYRAALAKIFRGKRIDCALIWTDGPALTTLSAEELDGEISRIAARLATA